MTKKPNVNFSNYSDKELLESLTTINREKFPENHIACQQEIEKRKKSGLWELSDVNPVKKKKTKSNNHKEEPHFFKRLWSQITGKF